MRLSREQRFRRATCLGGCFLFSISTLLAAGTNSPRFSPALTNLPPPLLPRLQSPVDTFRELLAMSPIERRRSLTNRPPEVQKRILAKLREYEVLVWIVVGLCTDSSNGAEIDVFIRFTECRSNTMKNR